MCLRFGSVKTRTKASRDHILGGFFFSVLSLVPPYVAALNALLRAIPRFGFANHGEFQPNYRRANRQNHQRF